jgi:hypothetical protein
MIEGTIAGLAAAVLASGRVDAELVTARTKRLDVSLDGHPANMALIDAATSRSLFVGSRALWEPDKLVEALLTRAEPGAIGLAAVGGCLATVGPSEPRALYIRFGPGDRRVLAALAPGLVVPVNEAEWRVVDLDETVHFASGDLTVALDGEREIEVGHGQQVSARVTLDGPRVVNVGACLRQGVCLGLFEL